jgi:hypothetical protein
MSDPEVKTALVDVLPACDVSGCDEPAEYDARSRNGWGNFCQAHFELLGCSLGLGKGQKLIVRGSVKLSAEAQAEVDTLCERCGQGCPEDSWNKETGRGRVLGNELRELLVVSEGMACDEAAAM